MLKRYRKRQMATAVTMATAVGLGLVMFVPVWFSAIKRKM